MKRQFLDLSWRAAASVFFRTTAALLVSVAILADAVTANSSNENLDALVWYATRQYERAIPILLSLAEQGDGLSQELLGNIYSRGLGLERDSMAAFAWYLRAAQQGRADAQLEIGTMYRDGIAVPTDGKLAMNWFARAAQQGDARAFNAIGELYQGHPDIEENLAEALNWLLIAANLDHAAAMHNLGSIYASGLGVVMDKIEAYKWFELSSLRTIGQEHANSVEARYWTEGYLTPIQVSRAKSRVSVWLQEHR